MIQKIYAILSVLVIIFFITMKWIITGYQGWQAGAALIFPLGASVLVGLLGIILIIIQAIKHNKVQTLVIFTIVAFLPTLYLVYAQVSEPRIDNPSVSEPIGIIYPEKVVYTTSSDADQTGFRKDCAARGGTFMECGSPCPSTAETCITMCAMTCEL